VKEETTGRKGPPESLKNPAYRCKQPFFKGGNSKGARTKGGREISASGSNCFRGEKETVSLPLAMNWKKIFTGSLRCLGVVKKRGNAGKKELGRERNDPIAGTEEEPAKGGKKKKTRWAQSITNTGKLSKGREGGRKREIPRNGLGGRNKKDGKRNTGADAFEQNNSQRHPERKELGGAKR